LTFGVAEAKIAEKMKVFSGVLLVISLTVISQTLAQISVLSKPENIESGEQADILLQFNINDRCSFELDSSEPDEFNSTLVNLTGSIGGNSINPDDFKVNFDTVKFTVSVDPNIGGNYTLSYKVLCSSSPGIVRLALIFYLICRVLDLIGVDCDPHFNQYIFNRETNETTRICYDVIAEPNQYLEIFTQPKMETRLVGQMKDDYYMHRIILQLGDGIIEADVDQILIFTGARKLLWKNVAHDRWTPFRGILFRQSKNTVEIKRHENDELTFRIVRNRDSVGKHYLDVFVNGLSTDYSGLDGLLGRIGNNRISVFPNVQSSVINRKTTVVVNGLKTIGYEKVRNSKECALVNVNDLLHPMKLKKYIVDEI